MEEKPVKGRRVADICGERFGMLTAIAPTEKRDAKRFVIWHCKCDCGNEVEISYNRLAWGTQRSCGCKREAHRHTICKELTHVDGTSMDILKSKRVPRNNTTGTRGVYFVRGKYIAKLVLKGRAYYLGTYKTAEEAAVARKEAEASVFDKITAYYERYRARAEQDSEWARANPIKITLLRENGELVPQLLPQL